MVLLSLFRRPNQKLCWATPCNQGINLSNGSDSHLLTKQSSQLFSITQKMLSYPWSGSLPDTNLH